MTSSGAIQNTSTAVKISNPDMYHIFHGETQNVAITASKWGGYLVLYADLISLRLREVDLCTFLNTHQFKLVSSMNKDKFHRNSLKK